MFYWKGFGCTAGLLTLEAPAQQLLLRGRSSGGGGAAVHPAPAVAGALKLTLDISAKGIKVKPFLIEKTIGEPKK